MGRGRRKRYNEGPQKHRGENRFEKMLNMRRVVVFEYDAEEILTKYNVEERFANPLLATIVSKASRQSISDAVDYINAKKDEGILPEDAAVELIRLLNRNKKWR